MKSPFNSPGAYLDRVLKSHRRKHIEPLLAKYMIKRREVAEFIRETFHEELAGPIFDSGSYSKCTDVNISFDLDMVVPFKHQAFGGPENIQNTLYKAVQKQYGGPGISIRPQRVSVGIKFPEKVGKEMVSVDLDIVPGMEESKGAYNINGRLILNNREAQTGEKGNWITTNIQEQMKAFNRGSVDLERKVIRLLKVWKKHHKKKASSFLIELAVLRAFKTDNLARQKLIDALLGSMSFIATHLQEINLSDPGNANNNVANNLSKEQKAQLAGEFRNIVKSISKDPEKLIKYFPINPKF